MDRRTVRRLIAAALSCRRNEIQSCWEEEEEEREKEREREGEGETGKREKEGEGKKCEWSTTISVRSN